jgi:hypothetical protein
MPSPFRTVLFTLTAVCVLIAPTSVRAQTPASVRTSPLIQDVQFRGCDSAGWCRFWIDAVDPTLSLVRVRPNDVLQMSGDDALSIAVRNRLNALLSDMIHQAKHIDLNDLRKLDDGTYTATVTVTGVALASDPVLAEMREKVAAKKK